MKWYKIIIAAIFPNVCCGCNEIIPEDEHFCDYCFEMLQHTAEDKICIKCGLPKKNCDCPTTVFRFDGCVAPFYTDSAAKEAMYRFKFRRKEHIGNFFAQQMALSIKQCFPDIIFDAIAYVPLHPVNQRRRGYNQSRLLALRLSKILNVPIYDRLLICVKRGKNQHKTPRRLRRNNVKNKYICNHSVIGKKILLVDDIKTTGATLDECTKQLLLNGADRVFCVTGLITKRKEKKKNGN